MDLSSLPSCYSPFPVRDSSDSIITDFAYPSLLPVLVSPFLRFSDSRHDVRHHRGKLPPKLFRNFSIAFTRVRNVGALKASQRGMVIFAQVNRVRNIGTVLNISLLIKIHEFSRHEDADYYLT